MKRHSWRTRGVAVAAFLVMVSAASATTAVPAWATGPSGRPVVAGIDLERATIPDLQRAMRSGRLSSVELTAFYLQRIRKLNPTLHAVLSTNPDALRLAADSDARRHRHRSKGPMDGIPVLLKDNIDTADRQPTTAGSTALLESRPYRDAGVVENLREAGAVILGKANLSEWSSYRSTSSSNGWSPLAGQTANPYVLDRNPCGSSSGPGVAVAAHLATVAVGTETDGSISCPSGANGIVGVKPSLGLVSRSGIVPVSKQQDTAGPMARNVVDAAILLAALNGADRRDPITVDAARQSLDDYTRFLRPNALRGKRIGVWREVYTPDDTTKAAFEQALSRLRKLGATTVEITIPYLDVIAANEFPAIRTEFKHDINAYLASTGGKHPADLAGLIQYNLDHAAIEMPYWTHNLWDRSQATTGDLTDPAYRAMREAATSAARRGLDETLRGEKLDAIVAPTNNAAWKTQLGVGDGALLIDSSGPAAVSGYANMTVPMAYAGPLPLGLSIMGGRFSEPSLLAIAYAFEQDTKVRRLPTFIPSIG
ncbi:amidase [Amycolatopsis lurida NRRL 2430]|uniref:Amidase n=2 Tax=Amycolatopsis lurida TaxID=31959 RepID=A0A2P2FK16_AMYLU|nr:amidase [Amycolatopsis lurida NRRL 2430]